jgi:hypothetical protein
VTIAPRDLTWDSQEALPHAPWPAVNPPLATGDGELPTDKFTMGYYPAYEELAAGIGPGGRVLEVGIAYGGSLMMWQRLFPRGLVAGADWDPDAKWPEGTRQIRCAQDDPQLFVLAAQISCEWDLIVDDASHHGALTEATFGLLWPLVAPGGWYVIEDWQLAFTDPWKDTNRFGGDAMLRLAASFIRNLEPAPGSLDFTGQPNGPAGSGIAEARYRYGQAMLRKVAL